MSEQEFMGGDPIQPKVETPPAAATGEGKSDYSELLAAITNPEGNQKYKSVADALVGAVKAQEHIRNLETENATLRGLSTKVETMEELIKNLNTKPQEPTTPQASVENPEALILSVLEKREAANRERLNRQSVIDALRNTYGDKVEDVLKTKADDLGLSLADLGALAARSPKAVLAHFQLEKKGTPSVQGTVNTQALLTTTQPAAAPENIMWGASTKELVNYWQQIKSEVNSALG